MPADGVAREIRAAYRAHGVRAEVDTTLPLSNDERVITEGMVRRYVNTFIQRPCYLRLTGTRLVMLEHFATRPDRVTEIPAAAVERVEQEGQLVLVTWRTATATRTVRFQPRSRLFPVRWQLPDSADELAHRLLEWRAGAS